MWIPNRIVELLNSNRDEVVKLRTELDAVKGELTRSHILNDFFRTQINTLQFERQALLEKAHGIKVPAPILEKAPTISDRSQPEFSFEDIGEELAKKLGLPTYDS